MIYYDMGYLNIIMAYNMDSYGLIWDMWIYVSWKYSNNMAYIGLILIITPGSSGSSHISSNKTKSMTWGFWIEASHFSSHALKKIYGLFVSFFGGPMLGIYSLYNASIQIVLETHGPVGDDFTFISFHRSVGLCRLATLRSRPDVVQQNSIISVSWHRKTRCFHPLWLKDEHWQFGCGDMAIWINYNDLTVKLLEWWSINQIIPKWLWKKVPSKIAIENGHDYQTTIAMSIYPDGYGWYGSKCKTHRR